ncbi:SBBP repeat-containing protein [Lacrimispora xylanolytica]|uniref:SBBP repeat-containing protein n=1 Tax=Lacrimispora xylanolytica TaxID=29375 RepID=A0ABY7AAJ4_9FIRM|nr:SBBP repeat-containing protein [Lacrimispora xylanolytica]WAJ23700.1 SBBP repeat-containing protein [Lacrimispora xylanolytica]
MQNIVTNPYNEYRTKLPLSFVKNNGQEDIRAHFSTNYKGRRFFFSSDRITSVELEPVDEPIQEPDDLIESPIPSGIPRNGVAVELSFVNANPTLTLEGVLPQPGYHHFYRGNDSTKWSNGIPHYKELHYPAVWEGVDLELLGGQEGLKMNWVLDGPDRVSSIRLHWAGADSLELDAAGNLLVHHALGTLTDLAPIAYQEIDGERKPVDCVYRLYGSFDLGFELTGSYIENTPLIIDPILMYATYLGGSLTENARGIAVDTQGCAYVTGTTTSVDFPITPGAFQTTAGGVNDAYVTKFASDGSSLIYSTYLGGSNGASANSIFLDTQECAYITGSTGSTDFPITPGAYQTTPGSLYVTKLAPDGGSLIYSTYLGGTVSGSSSNGIVVDLQGHAHVAGYTSDTNFPITPGAFQTTNLGLSGSGFITKFSTDGGSLIYSTFLGGTGQDIINDITVDTQGYAYVTGATSSTDFPVTPSAFQTTFTGSSTFITKLALDGSALIYSTFLSGTSNSSGRSISVDTQGNSYITGRVDGPGFPVTANAFQTTYGGGAADTFATKLSPGGDSLIASTYLGGTVADVNYSGAIDMQGHIYAAGYTTSPNFPLTPEVIPSVPGGIYISIFSADLAKLLVSYCLGDWGAYNMTVGREGAVYVTGQTFSTEFPATPGAFQTTLNGASDAFVTKTGFAFYRQASVEIDGITTMTF